MPKKKPSTEATAPVLYVVMKAYSWSSVTAGGMPMMSPPEGPQRFMPVFNSREQAVAWDNGCEDNISIVRST